MAQCPLCGAQVPDDFGLIECGGCGAPLIVHMDGRVEHSGAEVGEPVLELPPPGEFEMEVQDFAPLESADELPPAEPSAADEAIPLAEPFAESSIVQEKTQVYRGSAPTISDSPDLSDIARFGNSEASSARDGSLRYNLFISGIDTSDVREAFREAITDRKLVWDTEQILRSLKNGEVNIAGVPAAKAYILVSRLRNLPVQVRWEQYALSQT